MKLRIVKNHSHARFYSLLSLLLLLISLRYAFQINIPKVIFLGIILLNAFLGDRDEIVAMCMCCIPLHESIDFFYSIVICISMYLLKYHREVRINLTFIPVITMVFWELLHCLGETFSIVGFLTDIIPLLALLIFLCADVSEYDYAFIARSVATVTAVICIMLLLKVLYLSDFNLIVAFANLQRLGVDTESSKQSVTVSGGEIHPNILGVICVLATTGLMQLRTAGKGEKKDLLMACTLLVFGTLTSSRTFLVCLALMVVLLLFSQKGSLGQKLRFLGIVILVLILALVVLNFLFPELMQYYYSRFQVKDITTGRIGLMSVYHEFIVSNPEVMMFGIGLHDLGPKVIDTYMLASVAPHNAVQEMVIAWGLPGLILFVVLMVMMILRSRQFCRRQGLINYIPLLIILVKSQAGQMLNSGYTMMAFSYAYLSMTQNLRPSGGSSGHTGVSGSMIE